MLYKKQKSLHIQNKFAISFPLNISKIADGMIGIDWEDDEQRLTWEKELDALNGKANNIRDSKPKKYAIKDEEN